MAVLERLTYNAPAVSESFGSLPFQIPFFSLNREGQIWAKKNSTVNSFEAFAAVKTVGTDCITRKLTRNVNCTGSFPDTAEDYAPDVSLQGRIPCRYALRFFLLSTAPCKSPRARVRPTHGLERRLVRLCGTRLIFVSDPRGLPTGCRRVQWAVRERSLPSVRSALLSTVSA